MPATVSRRTITKGAAWSVPVVALATAAPAAAASGSCTVGGLHGFVIDDRVESDTRVSVAMLAEILSNPVCTGGAGEVEVTLRFSLDTTYTSWATPDLAPSTGRGSGPFQTILGGSFTEKGDGWTIWLDIEKQSGVEPRPIQFELSAPGSESVLLTAFPTEA